MQLHHIFLLFFLSFTLEASTEQRAVTQDGRQVILRSDGTWSYLQQSEQNKQNVAVEKGGAPKSQTRPGASLIELVGTDTSNVFRSVRWNMSPDEIRKAEDATFKASKGDTLEYSVDFFGYTTQLLYIFSGNKLVMIRCVISQPESNPTTYYRDYEEFKKNLIPLYGRPAAEHYDWKNDMYRNDKSRWGFAAGIGFLTCRTEWQTPNSLVSYSLSGSNHRISTFLEYRRRK